MSRRGTKVEVQAGADAEPMVFNVTVTDSAGSTRHRVTLSTQTWQQLTGGRIDAAACVAAAFEFLLDREAKSDILPSFDINVIKLSFPAFERDFPTYLTPGPR